MLNAGFSTLTYLKSRLLPEAGVEETQWDEALGKLGLAVASRFQSHCNRRFDRTVADTHTSSARSMAVSLKRYPVESVASVEILDADGTSTAVALTSFTLDAASGMLEFPTPPGSRTQNLVTTYTGGFWLDDGEAMPAGATPLPDDLLEAWLTQCQATAASRNLFGAISLADPKLPKTSGEMLPEVTQALLPYRRFSDI